MNFPLESNIDDYVVWNGRGRDIQALYKQQAQGIHVAAARAQPLELGPTVERAIRDSALGPFIYEFNQRAGLVSVESQQATLDLLKFSYCKAGEAAWWDARAALFPHIQYVVQFIEEALSENYSDGRITLAYVHQRLTCLNLHGRSFTSLDEALAKFLGVRFLNLSWNLIESTASFVMPPHLYYLNLEMNLLSDLVLRSQSAISYLSYLNLCRNRFDDSSNLSVLQCLQQLLMLDLSYNDIHTLDTVWRTVSVCRLRSLNLIGNPCSVTADYFVNVIRHVPLLLFLDHVPVSDGIKKEIQHKASFTDQAETYYPFSKEAELSFHCYRTLQFKFEDGNRTVAAPSKESLISKKSAVKKSKKRPKAKSFRKESVRSAKETPPVTGAMPTDVLYRFEIECPILNESLHALVDFVTGATNEDELVPNELLERTTLKAAPVEDKTKDTNESTHQGSENDPAENNEPLGMTVREARELLTSLRHSGDEAISVTFPSTFISNALPEAPIMEFSPILLRGPHNDLKLLSTLFYTQVKVHFVQIHVLSAGGRPSNELPRKQVKKKPSKGTIKSRKSTPPKESPPEESTKPQVVSRTILHTIVLDQLAEPTWAEDCRDFVWTQSAELKSAERLKDLQFERREQLEHKKMGKNKQHEVNEAAHPPTPLPDELTVHLGISLKRTHDIHRMQNMQ